MTRGEGDARRRIAVLVFSWLLVASSVVGAGGIAVGGGTGAGADVSDSSGDERAEATVRDTPTVTSGTVTNGTTDGASAAANVVAANGTATNGTTIQPTSETTGGASQRALIPRFDFACDRVAVTARGYDSVTLVFADGDRQTFRWSFRGRNVFFGTGENVGAVVVEVIVRRDGERVSERNPDFEACTGRTATAATIGTTAPPTSSAVTGTPGTTGTPVTSTTIRTPAISTTLDLPTIVGITTSATTLGTTVRGTTTTIPTPTVTPQPIAGFPECSDEEFGLSNALSLTYRNGTFASANATEIEANRFRFTVEDETYVLELVEVERNEAGDPVSVTFDATLPVDGVIVRTGQGANVYEFPEGVSHRADLRAPTDENTGRPFSIEEITFCYDSETPTRTDNGGGPLDDLGLGILAGRDAAAAVGLAAAGLLVARRRRFA